MIDYTNFPGLSGVYLEDSYVLAISDTPDQLTFQLDAVLTPESSAYHAPRPGEQYCYAAGNLIFPHVTRIEWVAQTGTHFTDASGDEDLGNIDVLDFDGKAFVLEGDWGRVRVCSGPPWFEHAT